MRPIHIKLFLIKWLRIFRLIPDKWHQCEIDEAKRYGEQYMSKFNKEVSFRYIHELEANLVRLRIQKQNLQSTLNNKPVADTISYDIGVLTGQIFEIEHFLAKLERINNKGET